MEDYNFFKILPEEFLEKLRDVIWDTLKQKIKANIATYKKNHPDYIIYVDIDESDGLVVEVIIVMPNVTTIDSVFMDTNNEEDTYKFWVSVDWAEEQLHLFTEDLSYLIERKVADLVVWGSEDYILNKIKELYDESNHQECILIYSFIEKHTPHLLSSLNKVPGAETIKWLGEQTDSKLTDLLWHYKDADLFISDVADSIVYDKEEEYVEGDTLGDNSRGVNFDFEDFIEESNLSEYVDNNGKLTITGKDYIHSYMIELFKDKKRFENEITSSE